MRLGAKRILGVFAIIGLLLLTSCSSSPYSSAPPGSDATYMGVGYYNGFYGGPWYGPGYRPPAVVVPPRPPQVR